MSSSDRKRYRTWSGRHGKRLPKELYEPGYPVHVIVCCRGAQAFFTEHSLATDVFRLPQANPATLAACLMPDHLHWLLNGEVDFSREVRVLKSRATRIAWSNGLRGKLWQRSFYDHVVLRSEGVLSVARYIVRNPVRKGLVTSWREYPFSILHEDRIGGLL